jgi:hypothetical protein
MKPSPKCLPVCQQAVPLASRQSFRACRGEPRPGGEKSVAVQFARCTVPRMTVLPSIAAAADQPAQRAVATVAPGRQEIVSGLLLLSHAVGEFIHDACRCAGQCLSRGRAGDVPALVVVLVHAGHSVDRAQCGSDALA